MDVKILEETEANKNLELSASSFASSSPYSSLFRFQLRVSLPTSIDLANPRTSICRKQVYQQNHIPAKRVGKHPSRPILPTLNHSILAFPEWQISVSKPPNGGSSRLDVSSFSPMDHTADAWQQSSKSLITNAYVLCDKFLQRLGWGWKVIAGPSRWSFNEGKGRSPSPLQQSRKPHRNSHRHCKATPCSWASPCGKGLERTEGGREMGWERLGEATGSTREETCADRFWEIQGVEIEEAGKAHLEVLFWDLRHLLSNPPHCCALSSPPGWKFHATMQFRVALQWDRMGMNWELVQFLMLLWALLYLKSGLS